MAPILVVSARLTATRRAALTRTLSSEGDVTFIDATELEGLLGEALAATARSVREVIAVLEAATRSAAEGGQPVEFR